MTLRANCPFCKGILKLRHTGDGEVICEGKCDNLWGEEIISYNKFIETKE